MEFKVSGSRKDDGSRIVVNIKAKSKADATKRAGEMGIIAGHVEAVDGSEEQTHSSPRGGPPAGKSGGRKGLFILVGAVIVIFAGYYVWQALSNPTPPVGPPTTQAS